MGTYEFLVLATVFDLDDGLSSTIDDFEREVLHVSLNLRVGELAANESLRVEDGVVRVHSDLIFGGVPDETLVVEEGNI